MNKANYLMMLMEMSVDQAFDVLGINPENYKASDLVGIYRKAALKNHPDKGGDVNVMTQINLAYEKLKGGRVGSVSRIEPESKQKEKEEKELKKKIILRTFRTAFNSEVYKKYFEKASGLKLEFTENELEIDIFSVGLVYEFFTPDKATVFRFNIEADYSDVDFTGSLGAGDGEINFKYLVDNYIYHAKRKQKMKRQTYSIKSTMSDIVDPEKLFPKAILKKIFGGKKQRKFSKKDFITGLARVLGATYDGEYAQIPLKGNLSDGGLRFLLSRDKLMKVFSWRSCGFYDGAQRVLYLSCGTLPETEESLDFIIDVVKKMRKKSDVKGMGSVFQKEVKATGRDRI